MELAVVAAAGPVAVAAEAAPAKKGPAAAVASSGNMTVKFEVEDIAAAAAAADSAVADGKLEGMKAGRIEVGGLLDLVGLMGTEGKVKLFVEQWDTFAMAGHGLVLVVETRYNFQLAHY